MNGKMNESKIKSAKKVLKISSLQHSSNKHTQ